MSRFRLASSQRRAQTSRGSFRYKRNFRLFTRQTSSFSLRPAIARGYSSRTSAGVESIHCRVFAQEFKVHAASLEFRRFKLFPYRILPWRVFHLLNLRHPRCILGRFIVFRRYPEEIRNLISGYRDKPVAVYSDPRVIATRIIGLSSRFLDEI